VHVLVAVERGERDDRGRGGELDDPGGRCDPVDARHPQVHEHDIRLVQHDGLDGLRAVGRAGDDLDPVGGAEDGAQVRAHHRLVVDHEHAYRHRSLPHRATGSSARTANPPSAHGPASSVPPMIDTRSRRPRSPLPEPVGASAASAVDDVLVTATLTASAP
jgi:hypothetical protein